MSQATGKDAVLADTFGQSEGTAFGVKQGVLVVLGIGALIVAAKLRVPMWPVPITMGTFAILSIGAAYGPRLGFVTVASYLLIGALGFDVFAGSSAELNGPAYMMGNTGGYLAGYVLAVLTLGLLARRGWDRSVGPMVLAMLIGNAIIYVPGLFWLGRLHGWDRPILEWGLYPFLIGDAMKLALAAMLFPAIWRRVGAARN